MGKQKKLMVLGASGGQLTLIQRAVELGHYVITVDYLPDNIGHQFSHQYVNCSTVDQAGVLQFAQDLRIDGITTIASDVATATVSFVTEQMALPGCPAQIANTMSNKANFRRFQCKASLNSPDFVTGDRFDQLADKLFGLTPPLMFKPVDTSGSRGILRVDSFDYTQYEQAFDYARQFARSKVVCVEEFVDGVDVSGDGFLVAGELHAVITQKYKQGYIPTGHSLPTNLSSIDQVRVLDEVASSCQALNYTYGPIDFDVKVSPERVVVIEMSPRLGGNGIPNLIRRATGADLIQATIRFALGEPSTLFGKLAVTQPCGSWVFGSPQAGRLIHIASPHVVRTLAPEVFEYEFSYQIGEELPVFEHSGNSLGYALFDCPADSSYCDMVERLRVAMQIKVDGGVSMDVI
jgi:formate-dependent phosphoribosylglycinamide formyltransferase (GAR transformylase)